MEKAKLQSLVGLRVTLVTDSGYIRGKVIAVDDSCTQVVEAQIIERPAFHEAYKESHGESIEWLLVNNMKVWDAYMSYDAVAYNYSVSSKQITP